MEARTNEMMSLRDILGIMCAPEPIDVPAEGDYLPRSMEDEIADDLFVQSWVAKRKKEMR